MRQVCHSNPGDQRRWNTALRPVLLCLLLMGPAGCAYDPGRLKLPELWPRDAATERRAAEYHDPFPDDSMGPGGSMRPREFSQQRTATRQAAEMRGIHLLDSGDPLPPTSLAPPPRFSRVVQP